VRGADRVGVVHDDGAPCLVPPDGQGQAERQDQPDNPEDRALQDGEWLAQGVAAIAKAPADPQPQQRGAENDPAEYESQKSGVQ
jgi:hypothetical protein